MSPIRFRFTSALPGPPPITSSVARACLARILRAHCTRADPSQWRRREAPMPILTKLREFLVQP